MSFFDRFRRSAPEERDATLANPSAALQMGLTGGYGTFTGNSVTPDKAMTSAAVFAAVRVISNAGSTLPLKLYKEDDKGSRIPATSSPVWSMLTEEPNPEMAIGEWTSLVLAHLSIWGNAFILKQRDNNGNGPVRELWPLDPRRFLVGRDENGKRYFQISDPTGQEGTRYADERDILHIRSVGTGNGLLGLSPIQQCKQRIAIVLAQDEFQGRLYANDATPGGLLKAPGALGDEAVKRLKANWKSAHQGLRNTGKIAVLEDGLDYQQLGLPPDDLQFIDSQRMGIQDICRIFGIPAWMLGESSGSSLTYSTTESSSSWFVRYSLQPLLGNIEQSIRRDGDIIVDRSVFPWYDFDSLVRGDILTRYRAYEIGLASGFLKINEIRKEENMNPLPGNPEPPPGLKPLGVPKGAVVENIPPQDIPPQPKASSNGRSTGENGFSESVTISDGIHGFE